VTYFRTKSQIGKFVTTARAAVKGRTRLAELDAVETALAEIGTPADRIHTERFDWV
jgi:hypothetical protein